MKNMLPALAGAAILGAMAPLAPSAMAQTATVETSSTSVSSAGTISTFSPESITVRSETAAAPIAYRATSSTTYVDDAGSPVSVETVKAGLPVTVYYSKESDGMVASKVVVHKTTTAPAAVQETTTTTTTTETDD
jgi:hypothetical protein